MATTDGFVPDYLLIGHIAHDVSPRGPQLGGTVSYGAHTAAAFGLRVGILTSTRLDEPLLRRLPPQAVVASIPAEHTTVFDNRYQGNVRTQYMYHRAHTLTPDMLPPAWRQAPLVHLGPIAYEVDPAFMNVFAGRICVTPQGWMRQRDPDGCVRAVAWTDANPVLSRAALTVLSEEDIRHDPGLEAVFAQNAPLMVLTRAERGGTVYVHGHPMDFPAYAVDALLDPTGAGDVFATSLHIALHRLGDLGQALRVATYVAAMSVTRVGFAGAPTPDEVAHAWALAAPSAH